MFVTNTVYNELDSILPHILQASFKGMPKGMTKSKNVDNVETILINQVILFIFIV